MKHQDAGQKQNILTVILILRLKKICLVDLLKLQFLFWEKIMKRETFHQRVK